MPHLDKYKITPQDSVINMPNTCAVIYYPYNLSAFKHPVFAKTS